MTPRGQWLLPACCRTQGIGVTEAVALIVPALSFLDITIIGRLIVTEIVLLGLLPWLLRQQHRPRVPRWFVILWAGWLLSQVVTDLVVGSAFADLARGWAGIVFTLTNFTAILVLVSSPVRARLFAVGLAIAGLLALALAPHPYAAADPWKWGLALPVGLALGSGLSGRADRVWQSLASVAFVAFGVGNLLLGYRSLGGISFLVATYLALSALIGRRGRPSVSATRHAVLGLGVLAIAAVAVLGVYGAAASQGVLGREAQERYSDQAGAFGALLGGRSEALVSTQAILDSPLLGHGSWAKDPYYAELLADRQESLGYEVTPEYVGADLIPAHSYLLGAWVWAGILGGAFWLAVGAVAVWMLAQLYSYRVALTPLLAFAALLLLWDITFSPYGHSARILAPYTLAVCLLGLRLISEQRLNSVAPRGCVV